MKVHHTQYIKNYKAYILGCLDSEEDLIGKSLSDEEKISYLFNRFNKEYGFMVERVGKQKAIAEWLSGLAIDIPFYYEDIINLAVEMGSIDPNPNDKTYSLLCDNYWDFMACMILLLEPIDESSATGMHAYFSVNNYCNYQIAICNDSEVKKIN
jgi:hypothetical protein|tara:strand:- start:1 stop:462 length:462 start_codon:yes stop_codon:yes gene_type:complete